MEAYPGIKPGGLTSEKEAMILVCFLIDKTRVPLNKDNILNIIAATRVANYFDTASAVERLLENMNIMYDKDGALQLTPTGSEIADELSSSLPFMVREDALEGLEKENTLQRQLKSSDFIVSENERGSCDVEIRMNELNRCFFSLKLSGFEQYQTDIMKERFYKNPSDLYQACLKILLNYNPKAPEEVE